MKDSSRKKAPAPPALATDPPRAKPAASKAPAPPAAVPAPIKVLLIDDHPVVRRGLGQIISEAIPNVVIQEGKNAQEALEALWSGKWDVVVLDVTMPGRNGLDVLKEVKQTWPKLPVLVLSVHSEDEFAMRVLQSGAAGYLTKGTAPQELVTAVKKLLTGGKYISASVAEKLASHLDRDAAKPLHQSLSDREYQVMCMFAMGKTVKEIGGELSLSIKTISTYRSRIMMKMGMQNNAEIMRYALEHGLVDFQQPLEGGGRLSVSTFPAPQLVARDLRRSFKLGTRTIEVLRGISTEIHAGQAVFLCGASGAGKTTLLYTLAGLEHPESGTVEFEGTRLYHGGESVQARLRNERIGFVFQGYFLLPELTALENVLLPSLIRGRVKRDAALEALRRVGLADRLQHLPAELSGGEQQRVAIARALINDPSIIFADEPTGNLDSKTGEEIVELLLGLVREHGKTLVVVTHDAQLATRGDRRLEIRDGLLVGEQRAE